MNFKPTKFQELLRQFYVRNANLLLRLRSLFSVDTYEVSSSDGHTLTQR